MSSAAAADEEDVLRIPVIEEVAHVGVREAVAFLYRLIAPPAGASSTL